MATKKLRKRGYNQSELIARGISEVTKFPINNNLLYKVENVTSQTGKTRAERHLSMRENFSVNTMPHSSPEGDIILIDDVLTTGATLEWNAIILKNAYACDVYAATLARTL